MSLLSSTDRRPLLALVMPLALSVGCGPAVGAAERAVIIDPPAIDNPKAPGPLQTVVLAGGCFWGVQGVFEHVRGVRQAISGYAGGDRATANYDLVSSDTTGHAESVQVTYDPAETSLGELLRVFFSVAHDPTQLNRQGPDRGTQYRSAIFFADESQRKIAAAYIAQLDKARSFRRGIVTRVDPLKGFYRAEAHHQDFLVRNPDHPYIVHNDLPKIENLRKTFPHIYVDKPVLVRRP